MINTTCLLYIRRAVRLLAVVFSAALLSACHAGAPKASSPIRTLIVGGNSSHDFDRWYKQEDGALLEEGGLATVSYTEDTDSIATYLPNIDVLYLANNKPIKDPQVRRAILQFANAGKGLIIGHAANWYNFQDWPEYNFQLVGGGSRNHDKYGNFRVEILAANHPVTKGIQSFTLDDERYHYIPDPTTAGIQILANAYADGSDKVYPSVFVVNHSKARIVGITLGHDGKSHELPQYRQLLRQAVAWAAAR